MTRPEHRTTLARVALGLGLGVLAATPLGAQQKPSFDQASVTIEQKLQQSIDELNALYERLAAEKLPLNRELSELETELVRVRAEFQSTSLALETRSLDLSNLRKEIQSRENESSFVANLLGSYIENFKSGLHIAEDKRYAEALEKAQLAPENSNLTAVQVFQAQTDLLDVSLERLEEAVGGVRFSGTAVDTAGVVSDGAFVLVGPYAVFQATDGHETGTAEQRIGSVEPTLMPFSKPELTEAAGTLVATGKGMLPLDPTLGNAHKVEATEISTFEEVQKGGNVMIPIFVLASSAALVALLKWLSLMFVRKPSRRRMSELLAAVGDQDMELANERVKGIRGPAGEMLETGLKHMHEPRELIEEVMYESVLTTRLRLEKWLPFIAISAASAPLLGLLGTVTGIINTFKLITVFGSGDVKSLSGGISEALITTKYGLIVAIPSLLMHAFLSRKAKGVVNAMETAAVSFVNQVSKARPEPVTEQALAAAPSAEAVKAQVEAQVEAHVEAALRKHRESPVASAVAAGAAAGATAATTSSEVGTLIEPDPDIVRAQVKEILEEMFPKQGLGTN